MNEPRAVSVRDLPPWLVTGLVWAARLLVAGVFIWAAIPKLLDPVGFAEDISNYQVFPYWSWNLIAAIVPVLELVGALALLSGVGRKGAVALLGALDVAFIALIASVIVRDIDLSCGCFGQEEEAASIGWPTLWRDVGLLVAIAVSALSAPAERRRDDSRDEG